MAKPKVLLPYVFGLVSLCISLGMVSRGEWIKVNGLLSSTPSAPPLSKPEPFPGVTRLARCQSMSQPRFFFYVPTIATDIEKGLTISGTIYSSELTPLSKALVEIWQGDVSQVSHPYPPIILGGRVRTDETGHYEFTTTKFTLTEQSYLHYRVTYRDYCPLLMDLHVVVEPSSKLAKPTFAQVEVIGPVLQGMVNIVMPVPPAP
jgi:hypothetical protein